jgi:hypothetical protein
MMTKRVEITTKWTMMMTTMTMMTTMMTMSSMMLWYAYQVYINNVQLKRLNVLHDQIGSKSGITLILVGLILIRSDINECMTMANKSQTVYASTNALSYKRRGRKNECTSSKLLHLLTSCQNLDTKLTAKFLHS